MRKKICLILEGTYPYVRGGVGMWAHDLIRRSPQHDFTVVAVTDSPKGPRDVLYELPPYVLDVVTVNLNKKLPSTLTATAAPRTSDSGRLALGIVETLKEMEAGDFSGLERLVQECDRTTFAFADLLFNEALWKQFVGYASRLDGENPFAGLFWTWQVLFETTARLLRAPIPEADVYHSASTGYAGLLACLAKVRTGKPFVLSEHGLYLQERQMELAFHGVLRGAQREFVEGFFSGVSRWCYGLADEITSLCGPIREHQISLGAAPAKTFIVPNGINVQRFASLPRVAHEGFHIGLVGRVAPVKDVKLLIFAAKELLSRIPELRVSIAGPSADPGYFRECQELVARLGLERVVRFLGFVDAARLYPELDMLVLCSLKEVQPLAVLEAMAARIPVVATQSGGIPEILGGIGALVPPRNLDALVKTIRRVYEDKAMREVMVRLGFERVSSTYAHEKSLDQFHRFYAATEPVVRG